MHACGMVGESARGGNPLLHSRPPCHRHAFAQHCLKFQQWVWQSKNQGILSTFFWIWAMPSANPIPWQHVYNMYTYTPHTQKTFQNFHFSFQTNGGGHPLFENGDRGGGSPGFSVSPEGGSCAFWPTVRKIHRPPPGRRKWPVPYFFADTCVYRDLEFFSKYE